MHELSAHWGQGKEENMISNSSMWETIINNLPGIFVGITGLLTGIASIIKARKEQKKIKKELQDKVSKGVDFQNSFNYIIKKSDFQDKFLSELLNDSTIRIIADTGKFITKDDDKSIVDCLNRELAKKAIFEALILKLLDPANREKLRRVLSEDKIASIPEMSEPEKITAVTELIQSMRKFISQQNKKDVSWEV